MADQIIVTVSGVDKVGIVAEVTAVLAKNEVNIEDIKQTLMQGHFVMFMLGKHFSEKVALKFVKQETYDHYLEIVSGKKGKLTLFIAFLLPFFPDDALCLIAGSSNLTYKEFLIFLFLGRTPGIIYPSFLGAGIMGKDYKLLVAISIVYGIILFIIYIFRNKIIKDDIKDE